LLEAISHGLCEVVERDAATLWVLGGRAARDETRIDLRTVGDVSCRQVLERLRAAGVEAQVWETTADVGIPSFLCLIREGPGRSLRQVAAQGLGCHPARPVALLRALTEAAQGWLTAVAGSRDDMTRAEYDERRWHFQDLPPPEGEAPGPLRSFPEGPGWHAETFEEDVRRELECLRTAGVERVVVVNLTLPEFGVPVVRVVIPGLEVALLDPAGTGLGRRAYAKIAARYA
jgi:ribosomal protein S12 methylthiotransferase accessory factor